jgi:hypothetical protein
MKNLLLAAAALLALSIPALAQETAVPDRLRGARERWEKMSAEERAAVLGRFEKWRRLPADKREDLRRRFDEIGGREGVALMRRRMEELRRDSPEQISKMRLQAAVLERLWTRFSETLPPKVAERVAALPPQARERMRRRFSKAVVAAGREALNRRYATEAERAAIEGTDAEARAGALASIKARIREEVLSSRREELAALDPAERRVREARLLAENYWTCAREAFREKLPEVRASLEKALEEKAGNGHGSGKDWFFREFGITQEELGVRWAARPLRMALLARRPETRAAFLASVRPELRRIASLPAGEREEALKAFLETIR